MTGDELERHYRRYIEALNDRRLNDLEEFVADELVYNRERMTRRDYQNLIAQNIADIPDLRFDIGILVVAHDYVAARLNFACTPRGAFLGIRPNGQRIFFSEHVFYRFAHSRIAEVWSLIDRHAVEQQLGAART